MISNPSSGVPILALWEQYVADCQAVAQHPTQVDFATWLLRRQTPLDAASPTAAGTPTDDPYYERLPLPGKVGTLIWRISRYGRLYFKQHFLGTGIQTLEEFALLDGANYLERPTKTQLFQFDLMEATTGTQMLARLIKQGLLAEEPDPDDRRQKRVILTPAGRDFLISAYQRMHGFGADLFSSLPDEDLEAMERLLMRLNQYHASKPLPG